MLKRIFTGISLALCLLLLAVSSHAQADTTPVSTDTTGCTLVGLVRYTKYMGENSTESGLIIKGDLLECTIEKKGGLYLISLGSPKHSRPGLSFSCATIQPEKVFNGRSGRHRVGIWVWKYPWFGIRRIGAYNNKGKLYRVVLLRPNGTISGTRTWGSYIQWKPVRYQRYDKEGVCVSCPRGFH